MFNFKQALVYKINKKAEYENRFFNTYDNQQQILLDDGFIYDQEDEKYVFTEELTETHNIITQIEINYDEDETQYYFKFLQSKQTKK